MDYICRLISQIPATGNVEQKTYIIVIAIAAVLIIGAVIAGIFTKKKK
ncbi:MAG: LPXTG cell wall anchor domain-containing protein [Oscillospiraceae bacterium]|nr:LPXTG cell wall anchor domain-containing protein [Oscillospiraceae bacterium]